MLEKEGKHMVFRARPRVASIINMPVITTLYYCCMYHFEEPENLLGSPAALRKEHQVTENQHLVQLLDTGHIFAVKKLFD